MTAARGDDYRMSRRRVDLLKESRTPPGCGLAKNPGRNMKRPMTFKECIQDAIDMLRDRPRKEADLIYQVCRLEDDLRAGIIMAYQLLFMDEDDELPNR